MTHFLFSRRTSLFAEARLLRFAGAGPDVPAAPDTPPPVEAKAEAPKHKDVHAEAMKRMDAAKQRLAPLQKKLDDVVKFRDAAGAPGTNIDQNAAKKAGITDADADGDIDHDDVTKAHDTLKADTDKEKQLIDQSRGAMEESLEGLRQTGPAGKIDAALMKMNQTMKDGGSFGEMIEAFAEIIKVVQDLFKGINAPASGNAPASKPGGAGDRSDVKDMIDEAKKADPNVDTLAELRAAKTKELDDPARGVRPKLATARTNADAARQAIIPLQTQLDALNRADPKDDVAIVAKKNQVDTATTQAKGLEDIVKTLEDQEKKIQADIKKIDAVEKSSKEGAEKFNASRGALHAGLQSMIEKATDNETKADLELIDRALNSEATAGPDGEMKFTLAAGITAVEFQKAFVDQGVTNTAEFGINPADDTVGNPDAVLKGISQLLQKVGAKNTPKPPAAGAPGAGGAGA